MPSFDKYATISKTLFIRFKCIRCGHEEFEPLQDCDKRTGDRGNYLSQLSFPEGWYRLNFAENVLCPECYIAFSEFMKGDKK